MKQTLSLLIVATVLLFAVPLMAADRVVVIPLGSSAKGTDGQIQYNDDGKTSGAEVYYDKASGNLEVSGEVRTVNEQGKARMWGKGRKNTKLLTHQDPNGYCTSSTGTKYALSLHVSPWGNAAEVCPGGTWVCSQDDLPSTGTCPIPEITGYEGLLCDGTRLPATPEVKTELVGWLADAEASGFVSNELTFLGRISWGGNSGYANSCIAIRVWCCWK